MTAQLVKRKACIVDGCGRPRHYATGYCNPHQYRHKKYGDAMQGAQIQSPGDHAIVCSVDGCQDGYYCQGYCAFHYRRWRVYGDVGDPRKRTIQPIASPGGAHGRANKLWGPASRYTCVECPSEAKDWAYDGTDPTELYAPPSRSRGGTWVFFSSWPEFYMPMCRNCHRRMDGAKMSAELYEYRSWKHRTGLTLADIQSIELVSRVG